MNTLLFRESDCTVYLVDPCKRSEYGHAFGGGVYHAGTTASKGISIHLLYQFNLADPMIGLRIPNLEWFPLYYALRNVEGHFSYRVRSISEIEILSDPYKGRLSESVWEGFPEPIAPQPVELREHSYDPTKFEDACSFSGIFGLNKLSKKDMKKAVKRLTREFEQDFNNDPPAPLEEMLYYVGGTPFIQGHPRSPCPNRTCELHSYDHAKEPHHYQGRLRLLLAVFPEKQDRPLYEEIAGANMGQLIFEICPECYAVHVTNHCT